MIKQPPKFISTGYFTMKPGDWKISSDAPKAIKDEFNKVMGIKRDNNG